MIYKRFNDSILIHHSERYSKGVILIVRYLSPDDRGKGFLRIMARQAAKRTGSYKIGITGNICAGKTLVRSILERSGINTLDPAEAVISMLIDNPTRMGVRPIEHLGTEALDSRGRITRKKLISLLYRDIEKRALMENKLAPYQRDEIKRFLFGPVGSYIRAVESPNLLEEDTRHLYDEIWVVTTNPAQQTQRLMGRECLTQAEARYLIDAQWPQSKKASMGDRVIDNSLDMHETENQVRKALDEINLKVLKVSF